MTHFDMQGSGSTAVYQGWRRAFSRQTLPPPSSLSRGCLAFQRGGVQKTRAAQRGPVASPLPIYITVGVRSPWLLRSSGGGGGGSKGKVPQQFWQLMGMMRSQGKQIKVLGVGTGQPRE